MKKRRSRYSDEFQSLWHELRAINFWDNAYKSSDSHNSIEAAAYKARRRRLREIAMRFVDLNLLMLKEISKMRSC